MAKNRNCLSHIIDSSPDPVGLRIAYARRGSKPKEVSAGASGA